MYNKIIASKYTKSPIQSAIATLIEGYGKQPIIDYLVERFNQTNLENEVSFRGIHSVLRDTAPSDIILCLMEQHHYSLEDLIPLAPGSAKTDKGAALRIVLSLCGSLRNDALSIRMDNLINGLPEQLGLGFGVISNDRIVLHISNSISDTLGYRKEDFVAEPITSFLTNWELGKLVTQLLAQTIRNKWEPYELSWRINSGAISSAKLQDSFSENNELITETCFNKLLHRTDLYVLKDDWKERLLANNAISREMKNRLLVIVQQAKHLNGMVKTLVQPYPIKDKAGTVVATFGFISNLSLLENLNDINQTQTATSDLNKLINDATALIEDLKQDNASSGAAPFIRDQRVLLLEHFLEFSSLRLEQLESMNQSRLHF